MTKRLAIFLTIAVAGIVVHSTDAATPELVCATFLGTAGDDDLQDVAIADDGTIYVVGNLGETVNELPGGARPTTLGEPRKGTWYRCGFAAALSPDGSKVLRAVQFAEGQVFLTTIAAGDNGIYVGGYGLDSVDDLLKPLEGLYSDAKTANAKPLENPLPTPPDPPDASKPSRPEKNESGEYEKLTIRTRHHGDKSGIPIVLRLNPELDTLQAGTYLEGHHYAWNIMMPRYEEEWTPTGLSVLESGDLIVLHDGGAPIHHYYAPDYVSRLSGDLTQRAWMTGIWHPEIEPIEKIRNRREEFKEWKSNILGQVRTLRARGDNAGHFYVGGWSVAMTSNEPWWCPFLLKLNDDGKEVWRAYTYDPMSGPKGRVNGLVSDSAIRSMVPHDGRLLVSGISDGGNSVLRRDPRTYTKPAPQYEGGLGGMHGRELYVGHLLHLDANSRDLIAGTMLGSYGKGYEPAWAVDVASLSGNRVLAVGRHSVNFSATGDAWFQTDSDRGMFIQVWTAELDRRFSVNVPDAIPYSAATRDGRAVIVGMAESEKTPVRNAMIEEYAGRLDGYLMVIDATE